MNKFFCRVYQKVMYVATFFLPWRQPQIIKGTDSMEQLADLLNEKALKKVLVVTDAGLLKLGLLENMLTKFKEKEIEVALFDKTVANPTINNIEDAVELYNTENCQAIIAFGGGSPIDCAKGVGARIARPNKTIPKMRGLLKVGKKLPFLVAIPTTAGTGSETTLAAVVTNSDTHEKYAINDLHLIPQVAVLDPSLTVSLPNHITSTTGIDALTHAIEAYIGKSNTSKTKEDAKNATALIFENLLIAYKQPDNIEARQNMQEAAYLAGAAFTRAYVGNVHAIAHTLGGFYGVPHGLANAVILPYVLEYYGESVYKKLAELAKYINLCSEEEDNKTAAIKFINAVKELNKQLEIPDKIDGIKDEDIPNMIKNALREANPLYPVPRIFDAKDFENIYYMIKK